MDLLLESLRSVYNEYDAEQQWLDHIEEILLRPDALKEAPEDPTDLEDPAPVEKPAAEPEAPAPEAPPADAEAPVPAPEPAAPPVPQPAAKPAALPAAPPAPSPTLPSISKSQVKTPPKRPEPPPTPEPHAAEPGPTADAPPAAPEVDGQPLTPTDGSAEVDVEKKNRVLQRLEGIKQRGKAFKSPLDSEALSYMVYNPRTESLKVTFGKNNRSYDYKNVSMEKAATLIASDHKGTFFNRDIKQTSPATEVT
jgi:hypothetical protein